MIQMLKTMMKIKSKQFIIILILIINKTCSVWMTILNITIFSWKLVPYLCLHFSLWPLLTTNKALNILRSFFLITMSLVLLLRFLIKEFMKILISFNIFFLCMELQTVGCLIMIVEFYCFVTFSLDNVFQVDVLPMIEQHA